MDRDIDTFDRPETPSRALNQDERPMDVSAGRDIGALDRERQVVEFRGRTYRMSEAEVHTLRDIGRFRTIAAIDLAASRYGGNLAQMKQDLRSLASQGLVQRRSVYDGPQKLTIAVLTRAGRDWLKQQNPSSRQDRIGESQRFYAGFVKPAEVFHDAAIYRMYQAEAVTIQKQGATIRRVVLDYELKQRVYSPLAKSKGLPPLDYAKRQSEVAQANGLRVINGHIPLPDLRIEYETAGGELAKVDLELATHHYHGSHLAPKAEAGFKMYAADGSASRLSASLQEREITAAILSL